MVEFQRQSIVILVDLTQQGINNYTNLFTVDLDAGHSLTLKVLLH